MLFDDRNISDSRLRELNQIEINDTIGTKLKLKAYIHEKFKKLYETDLYLDKWTNNNSESLNNLIKQEIEWKPQNIPDLITKLQTLVKRKILDLKSSLHSQSGNWSLSIDYRRYAINDAKWNAMSADWRRKEFQKFLEDSKNVAKSEKAIGKKYKGLGVAKKPGQGKRPINERTH